MLIVLNETAIVSLISGIVIFSIDFAYVLFVTEFEYKIVKASRLLHAISLILIFSHVLLTYELEIIEIDTISDYVLLGIVYGTCGIMILLSTIY